MPQRSRFIHHLHQGSVFFMVDASLNSTDVQAVSSSMTSKLITNLFFGIPDSNKNHSDQQSSSSSSSLTALPLYVVCLVK
jgi:hypothetical protein